LTHRARAALRSLAVLVPLLCRHTAYFAKESTDAGLVVTFEAPVVVVEARDALVEGLEAAGGAAVELPARA